VRRLILSLALVAAAHPAMAGNFPTRQGQSGLLDVPDAELIPARTALFGFELGYDHAPGAPDHAGPLPLSIGVGLGRFEWAVSARQSGSPGDPRPAPMLFGTALKFGLLAPAGLRPGLAVDGYLDRFNLGGAGGGRLLLSTAFLGPFRAAAFGGYESQAAGSRGPTAGLAATIRAAAGVEAVLEGLTSPRGALYAAALRYDLNARIGLALIGSYQPDEKAYRIALAFGFRAAPPRRPVGPAAAPVAPPPAAPPPEAEPALAFGERPAFRLKLRAADPSLAGQPRHLQHAPYRQPGPAVGGAPPRLVTPSQDDVVMAQLLDQSLQLEASLKRLLSTDQQLSAEETTLDAEARKLDERERVIAARQGQLDAREHRLTIPSSPAGTAPPADAREAQLEASERQLAAVERGLSPTRDAALGTERDAAAREKADRAEAERLTGRTDAEKSKAKQGELRRQALGARQRMLAGMEARVMARGERLDAVTRQVRARGDRLDAWQRRLELRTGRLDRLEQQFISGAPVPAPAPALDAALPLAGQRPVFAMVVKAPTAIFATGAALAAGTTAALDPARPGGAGDRSVAAATVVAFASPTAKLAELDREALDGIARLAARERCELLVWARAKDPTLMNEANRRAEEIKALVVRLGNLPPRQVVTRITTRPGARGVDVVVSALREGGKARADAVDEAAQAAALGDGETARRQLRDAVVAVQPAIERCVTDQLIRRGQSRAEGGLKLSVTADGRVSRASAGNGDLGGAELEACLRPSIGAWRFPLASSDYLVDVPITVVGAGVKP
jgi:hypothetical protein